LLLGCHFGLERTLEPGELRGTVVGADAGKNHAVEGARVTVEGTALSARTDAKGVFALRRMPAGTFALRIVQDADGDGTPEAGLRLTATLAAKGGQAEG